MFREEGFDVMKIEEMELLTKNGSVTFEEYLALYTHIFSARVKRFIRLLPPVDSV